MPIFHSRFGADHVPSRFRSTRFAAALGLELPPPPPPPSNLPPTAQTDAFVTAHDTALVLPEASLIANDSDADGGALSVIFVSGSTGGTAVLNPDGSVTFTPTSGFSGAAGFTYTISDGQGGSDSAAVSVTVEEAPPPPPVNLVPTAQPDTFATAYETALVLPELSLLANDSDPDGGTLSLVSVSAGAGGTAVLNPDGSVTFTPTAGFSGAAGFTYTISDGQGGSDSAAVAVTVEEAPPPPPTTLTDANLNAVNSDGWTADYDNPGSFDPVGDPRYATVERVGHDQDGNSSSVRDDLLVMARLREPHPNLQSFSATNVVLQDFVYAGDAIDGVANNSSQPYPKPVAMWLDHDLRTVFDRRYTAKLAVAHWHARNGRPVAAVEFTATDGTTTVSSGKITTMERADYVASGLSAPIFSHQLDLTGLADNALITIDAIIYPWVGPSWRASTDFSAYPSINFTALKVLNLTTEGPVYAYVDGVGASPAVSESASNAAGTAFANVADALNAIQSYNAATFGRDDASGGVVRLTNTTHEIVSFFNVDPGLAPPVIEAADPAQKASTVLANTATGGFGYICSAVKFQNITLRQTNAGDLMFDNGAGLGSTNMLVFENCSLNDNGVGVFHSALIYRVGRVWAIECDAAQAGLFNRFSVANKAINVIGSDFPGQAGGHAVYNVWGSRLAGTITFNHAGSHREEKRGGICGFSWLSSNANASLMGTSGLPIGPEGLAFVGNVAESWGPFSPPVLSAAESSNPIENVLIQQNDILGQRVNLGYLDSANGDNAKRAQVRFTFAEEMNTKGDAFEDDGTLTGNWSITHKVGWHSNAYQAGSAAEDSISPGSQLGDLAAIGDVFGSNTAQLVPDFANDQSHTGGDSGGGDYARGPASQIPTYGDAALLAYPYDLTGQTLTASSHIGGIG